MTFFQEPTAYHKTALTDLQGAWTLLRDTVVDEFGFKGSDKLIFHIEEAMSWECIRNLDSMQPLILLIANIARQYEAPASVMRCIREVKICFDDVLDAIAGGEII